ncbi:MAG: hypothetical protein QOJ57_75, partial [Thermoleophilaceae bacterium]|nr:hypothetical protein [Thermoleophilaceae bacterium]
MRGDFTRSTYSRPKRYSGVRMQQGRVQLDADWNEQVDIQAHHDRVEARDVIGPSGVPKTGGGFQVGVTPDGADLTISPGRLYVNGILCELFATPVAVTAASGASLTLEALVADAAAFETGQWVELTSGGTTSLHRIASIDGPTSKIDVAPAPAGAAAGSTVRRIATLGHQPDLPVPPAAPAAGQYLVYADVWERMISGVEDPGILEPALGGPDTAVRTRTLAQVKLVDASQAAAAIGADGGKVDCSTFGPDWVPADAISTGRLRAHAEPDPTSDDPCVVPPRAGYRGLENQLYRVEVHDGSEAAGGATYKWSRDNGSTHALLVESIVGTVVTVADAGRDAETGFATARWIELSDERSALLGLPGVMVEVAKVEDREITVAAWPGGNPPALGAGASARRWDAGPAPIGAGTEALEQGVEVEFDGGQFRSGDWWLVPARTRIGDVLWPKDALTLKPLWEGRHGTAHSYCALALVTVAAGPKWDPGSITDCRKPFPPLTDLPGGGGCCVAVRPGEDMQAAIDTVIAAGGGCVSLCAGRYDLRGPLYIRHAAGFRLHGTTPATQVRFAGADDAGYSGIVVVDSVDVAVEDMFLVGVEGVPALVTLTSEHGGATAGVQLADLTLLQPIVGAGREEADGENGPDTTCAIALEAAREVSIERCRMIGPVGVLAAPGANERRREGEEGFGSLPVAGPLRMRATTIRFGTYGVLALRAHDWEVAQCRIEPLASESLLGRVHRSFVAAEEPAVGLLRVVEQVLERPPRARTGAAVYAITWVRSSLRECRLTGARAVEVAGWVGGGAFDNTVTGEGHGLHAMGLTRATWRGNSITCRGGVACSFGAVWRMRVEDNRIEAGLGVANLRAATLALELVRELRSGPFRRHAILAFVLDLPEALGVGPAFARFAASLDPRLVSKLLTRVVVDRLPETLRSRSGLPLVGLRVEGNEIDASEGCVFLHKHTALGGMSISRNRLTCDAGGAVRVDANRGATALELVARRFGAGGEAGIFIRVRRGADEFVQRATEKLGVSPGDVRPLAYTVVRIVTDAALEAIDVDYRIEGNAVLSLLTGIEANLTGIVIAGNEVEMIQSASLREDVWEAGKALAESRFLVPISRALVTGARSEGAAAARELAAAAERSADVRADSAGAAARLASRARTSRFKRIGARLVARTNAAGIKEAAPALAAFGAEIVAASASRAIVASGSGGWVVDNRVSAPGYSAPGARAQGGILIGNDRDDDLIGFGRVVAAGPDEGANEAARPEDAPTRITAAAILGPSRWSRGRGELMLGDMMVARNRVSGGEADGVEVRGGPGGGLAVIRENTIGEMTGAGILVGQRVRADRTEVADNKVSNCGLRISVLNVLGAGVAVLAGGNCAVTGNVIDGPEEPPEPVPTLAIVVAAVATVNVSRNRIRARARSETAPASGIGILATTSAVTIEDNDVEARGVALVWFPTPAQPPGTVA